MDASLTLHDEKSRRSEKTTEAIMPHMTGAALDDFMISFFITRTIPHL